MRFWDSSALVPLLVPETDSSVRLAQLRGDSVIAVWWSALVECESALQRRLRDGSLSPESGSHARARLADMAAHWHEVSPSAELRKLSIRLLRTHPLRAADALQIAAALTLSAAHGQPLPFLCADQRLLAAAEIEGLACL